MVESSQVVPASACCHRRPQTRGKSQGHRTKILASGTHNTQTVGNVMVSCETEVECGDVSTGAQTCLATSRQERPRNPGLLTAMAMAI